MTRRSLKVAREGFGASHGYDYSQKLPEADFDAQGSTIVMEQPVRGENDKYDPRDNNLGDDTQSSVTTQPSIERYTKMRRLQRYTSMEDFDGSIGPEDAIVSDGDAGMNTDVAVMDEVETIDEPVVAQTEIENQIENTLDASEALEHYQNLLKRAAKTGISKTTAKSIEIGINHIDKIIPYNVRALPSLEAFGGDTQVRATKISLESVKERAQKAYEWLKRLIKAAIDAFVDIVKGLFSKVHRVQSEAKSLLKEIQGVKAYKGRYDIELKNAAPLFKNGKFEGQNVAALADLFEFINTTYPKHVEDVLQRATTSIKSFDLSKTATEFEDELKAWGKEHFKEASFQDRKVVGGYTLGTDAGAVKEGSGNGLGLYFEASTLEIDDSARKDEKYTIADEINTADIERRLKEIIKLLENFKSIEKKSNQIRTAMERATDALKALEDKHKDAEGSVSTNLKAVAHGISRATAMSGSPYTHIGKIFVSTAQAYVGLLSLQVSQAKKSGKEKTSGGKVATA